MSSKLKLKLLAVFLALPALALLIWAVATHRLETGEARLARLQAQYGALAAELGERCPVVAADDVAAFDRCRQALFGASLLRANLPELLLWGRDRGLPLKETPLTQLAPDVYAGLYAPLFMFEGGATVEFDQTEQLYRARLPVRFRNRLPPGLFPYPFWHDKTKWSSYQSATELRFYIRPATGRIRVAQFHPGPISEAVAAEAGDAAAAFDGHWLWTDASGHTQPQVTVFDGLYSAANPHLAEIESTYQALALELRAGECDECHVPNNPNKMKQLVLLQTPAHAAGEIKRLIRAVRRGEMPEDKDGKEKPLPAAVKASLLAKAEAFDTVLGKARDWEARRH